MLTDHCQGSRIKGWGKEKLEDQKKKKRKVEFLQYPYIRLWQKPNLFMKVPKSIPNYLHKTQKKERSSFTPMHIICTFVYPNPWISLGASSWHLSAVTDSALQLLKETGTALPLRSDASNTPKPKSEAFSSLPPSYICVSKQSHSKYVWRFLIH